ncbi:MAG TPA: hypothetical protein PK523_00675 [Elusimicrobiales bacterium]|nr:hypothetical protein [Elusimicrobiales bacterium]
MQEHRIIIEFRLTRRKVLALLAAFFLCWHPAMLGSETLTLTTYYPAPYGGYARLLTTDETLLARDGGNVGIGVTTPGVKLDVAQHEAIRVGNAYLSSGGNYAHLANHEWYKSPGGWQVTGTPGALIQINGQNITFYRHNGAGTHDTSATIDANGNWTFNGTLGGFNGILNGLCRRVNYSTAGGSCANYERVVGYYPDPGGAPAIYGIFVDESGAPKGRMRLNADWQGQMICCKITN